MSAPTDDQGPTAGEQQGQPREASQGPPGAAPAQGAEGAAGERIQAIIQAAEKAAAGIIEDADAQARRYIDTSRERADALADERVRVMSDLTETLVRQAELVRRQSDELLSALDSARNELAGHLGKELGQGPPAPAAIGAPPTGAPAPGPPPAAAAPEPPAAVPEPPAAAPESPGAPPSQPPPGASRVPHLQPVESRPDLRSVESPPEPAAQPPAEPETQEAPTQAAPEPASEPVSKPPPPPAPQPVASPSAGATPSDGARLLAAQMAVAGSSRAEIETRLRQEFGIEDAGPILDGILGPG